MTFLKSGHICYQCQPILSNHIYECIYCMKGSLHEVLIKLFLNLILILFLFYLVFLSLQYTCKEILKLYKNCCTFRNKNIIAKEKE